MKTATVVAVFTVIRPLNRQNVRKTQYFFHVFHKALIYSELYFLHVINIRCFPGIAPRGLKKNTALRAAERRIAFRHETGFYGTADSGVYGGHGDKY
jgi:hypothetical protein